MAQKNHFYLALLGTIILAFIFPAVAAWMDGLSYIGTLCIMAMYLGMGLTTESSLLFSNRGQWKIVLFVQVMLFVIAPVYAYGLYLLCSPFVGKDAMVGILFIGCIPTTITSCIMLTKRLGGNDIASLYNAILSQFLGIVVTPLLLSMLLLAQFETTTSFLTVLGSLFVKVLIPFALGQLLRPSLAKRLGRIPSMISFYGIFVILFMNLGAAIYQGNFFGLLIRMIVPLVCAIGLCCLLLVTIVVSTKWLGFTLSDRICAVCTGSNKTLGMGIPLAAIYFPGNGDMVTMISLLIMMYYIFAMFASVFTARHIRPAVEG